MSHTTTVDYDFNDIAALERACEELSYTFRRASTVLLYSETVEGAQCSVKIPSWNYPIAVKDGKVLFDNYEGRWGDLRDLRKLQARYGLVVAEQRARARGQVVERVTLPDQRIELRVRVRR